MTTINITKLLKTTDTDADIKPYFYLESKWLDDKVIIKLQDSQSGKSYQATITSDTLKESALEVDVPYNEYYDECRAALTTFMALPGYIYKLDDDESSFKVWKKQADSIPMLYLEISLSSMRNHYDLLDTAIEQLQSKSKALTERVETAHKFDVNSREMLEDYRLCVEEKNLLEKKLLRKVAVLLNEKKQRIAELEERLKKYEEMEAETSGCNSDDDRNMSSVSGDLPRSSRKRPPLIVESDSDDDDFNANTEPLKIGI